MKQVTTSRILLIISVVSLATLGYLYHLSNQVTELKAIAARFHQQHSDSQRQLARLQNELAKAQQELNLQKLELSNALADLKNPGASPVTAAKAAAPLLSGAALQSAQDRARDFAQTVNSRAFQETMAASMFESTYGEFMHSLSLSAEDKERLAGLLKQHMADTLSGMQATNGEVYEQDPERRRNVNAVEEIMAGFLDDKQMADWQQYQDDAPIRAKAQVEAQEYISLGNGAPGLSDENRGYVADVLAETMINGLSALDQDSLPEGENILTYRYKLARDMLEGELEADQMAIVNKYFDNQSAMQRMFME